jgi:hypothetical protein
VIGIRITANGDVSAGNWSVTDGRSLARFADGMLIPAKGAMHLSRGEQVLQAFQAHKQQQQQQRHGGMGGPGMGVAAAGLGAGVAGAGAQASSASDFPAAGRPVCAAAAHAVAGPRSRALAPAGQSSSRQLMLGVWLASGASHCNECLLQRPAPAYLSESWVVHQCD